MGWEPSTSTIAFEGETPEQDIRAAPVIEARSEVWLLGYGVQSASYDWQLGHPFCFAHFINWRGGYEVLRYYREKFTPSAACGAPRAALAVAVLVAETEEKAQRLAASNEFWSPSLNSGLRVAPAGQPAPPTGVPGEDSPPHVIGDPEQARNLLLSFGKLYGVEEILVLTITNEHADRVRSYELLAEALEITPPG